MIPYRHAAILTLLAWATTGSAADWYVSPSGNDSSAGSQVAPWATIDKALTSSNANDRMLLERGGTWRGAFTIGGGRQLEAYGTGADPVLTTSRTLSLTGTWANNAAVRTATVGAEVLSLWVNGAFQPLARYPNSGFLSTATGTTLNGITATGLPARAAGRWTGAQVRWHRWHWFWETRSITADSGGGTLSLDTQALTPLGATIAPAETGLVGITSGFFIDKDLDELDAPGEWFSSASTLYVYPPAGIDAATMTVEVASTGDVITCNGATLRGLAFRRFAGNALTVNNPSTIEDCTFEQIGDTAVSTTYNSAPTVIRRSTFRDILNCGVAVLQNPASPNALIERNLFQRIGMVRGYGGSGTWRSVAVLANVGTATITLNRLVDIGYAGLLLGNTPGNIATRNLIVRALSTNNDGAGVYTYKGPNTISENIILDARGDQTAAEPFMPFGNGIWPEFLDGIANSQITDNTIAGCNGNGIALINNFTCNVSRNVLFDNLTSGLDLDVISDNTAGQGHTLDDNVFVTLATTRRLPVEGNLASWYTPGPSSGVQFYNTNAVDYGLLRRSTFVVGAGTRMAYGFGGGDPAYTTLAAFSAAKPSWVENSGTVTTGNAVLLINDTEATATLPVPAGTWTRTDGTPATGTVSLAAFRSVVLIGSGAAPVSPVYQVVSGIDWRQDVLPTVTPPVVTPPTVTPPTVTPPTVTPPVVSPPPVSPTPTPTPPPSTPGTGSEAGVPPGAGSQDHGNSYCGIGGLGLAFCAAFCLLRRLR